MHTGGEKLEAQIRARLSGVTVNGSIELSDLTIARLPGCWVGMQVVDGRRMVAMVHENGHVVSIVDITTNGGHYLLRPYEDGLSGREREKLATAFFSEMATRPVRLAVQRREVPTVVLEPAPEETPVPAPPPIRVLSGAELLDELERHIQGIDQAQGKALEWTLEPFDELTRVRYDWPSHDEISTDGDWARKPDPLDPFRHVMGTDNATYIVFLTHREDGTIKEIVIWFSDNQPLDGLHKFLAAMH